MAPQRNMEEKEQSVLWKSEGATLTRSLESFSRSPLAVVVWELFHLQTPYALLFPKRHSADVYSEDIHVKQKQKRSPQKKAESSPNRLTFFW